MKKLCLILSAMTLAPDGRAEDTPAAVFQVQCAACHAVDQMTVGPSLVEISGIYRDHPAEFVKWCVKPEHKREGVIEMPSMAHLGEPVLRELHGYILAAAAGKTELKKAGGDPFGVPTAFARRPQVQRIFMPDASPAAIAVALPGDLSFCFDAAECRLRYVWKGGFIDGSPYWKANGSSLAKLGGEVIYREEAFPLSTVSGEGASTPPRFLGYRIGDDGLPSFRYESMGIRVTETIRPRPDGNGIIRQFETDGTEALKVFPPVSAFSGVISIDSSAGTMPAVKDSALVVNAGDSKSFTLNYRWK